MARSALLLTLANCVAICVVGCATPLDYAKAPLTPYDKDTEYSIEERSDGFTIAVYYSRFQFIPETDAIIVACKSALTSIAHEVARTKGKRIDNINEQQIRLSTGRNGVSGLTSCSAAAPVTYLI